MKNLKKQVCIVNSWVINNKKDQCNQQNKDQDLNYFTMKLLDRVN